MGPCRIAKPNMKRHEPSVNANANFLGLIATAGSANAIFGIASASPTSESSD